MGASRHNGKLGEVAKLQGKKKEKWNIFGSRDSYKGDQKFYLVIKTIIYTNKGVVSVSVCL